MTPGARVQAAIEILGKIKRGFEPADTTITRYFRTRRYAGSKDRRAIAERVYDILRQWSVLGWWAAKSGGGEAVDAGPRARIIADLALRDKLSADDIAALFSGARFAPDLLEPTETAIATATSGKDAIHPDMPGATRNEYPDFLDDALGAAFGDALGDEMAALNRPAPVDLRVNPIKSTRDEARTALAEDGITTVETPYAPHGLRIEGRVRLSDSACYRNGLIEVQDEGSQLVSLVANVRPGMTVYDVCAGAGGKSLAMAAAMNNEGRIIACDISKTRLKAFSPRLRRSGIDIIETRVADASTAPWEDVELSRADLVVVDAPCSATGAWRRHPEERWRLTPETLAAHVEAQRKILAGAAPLVRPGGHLLYITCSVLGVENRDQVTQFLTSMADFSVVPITNDSLGNDAPGINLPPVVFQGPCLMLTPHRTGTDGFFAALLKRAN